MLHNEICDNPVSEKFKKNDLNQEHYDDLAQVPKLYGKELDKMMERNEIINKTKLKEIDEKLREMEFSKCFIQDRAKELEFREEKIDDGFKKLEMEKRKFEVEKRNFAQKSNKINAQLVEIKEQNQNLSSKEERIRHIGVQCDERIKGIMDKEKDLYFRMKFAEQYANELKSKGNELDNGFKKLESMKMEFAGVTASNADKERKIYSRMISTDVYAKELNLKEKELYNGFKELEYKKMEFSRVSASTAGKMLEIEEKELKLNEGWETLKSREKEVASVEALCVKRLDEIACKDKEVDLRKSHIEDYAKDIASKGKELDKGFKELESKKIEFTTNTGKFAGSNISDTSPSTTKRKRTSSDRSLGRRALARTELLPSPQVSRIEIIQNSEGGETFWTSCQSCEFRFEHHRSLLNKELTCRACSNKFTACELDAETFTPESNVYPLENLRFFANTGGVAATEGEGPSQ